MRDVAVRRSGRACSRPTEASRSPRSPSDRHPIPVRSSRSAQLPRTRRARANRPETTTCLRQARRACCRPRRDARLGPVAHRQRRRGVRARRRRRPRRRGLRLHDRQRRLVTRPWLDGDQWLLGKSMAGFCPVGPWIVTPDELDPRTFGSAARSTASRSRTAAHRTCVSRSTRSSSSRPPRDVAAGRSHRERHARQARHAAGSRAAPRAGRRRDVLIEGIGELATTIA